jgi:hypothetical protein
MNFKILSVAIVVAAMVATLASMPLTATPAYAGGNTHFHQNNNKAGSVDNDFSTHEGDQITNNICQDVTGNVGNNACRVA